MELSLLTSFVGAFVFFSLMAICFRYANGKWDIATHKKEAYNLWVNKYGTKVKRTVINLSIIFGLFMAFQIISLLYNK